MTANEQPADDLGKLSGQDQTADPVPNVIFERMPMGYIVWDRSFHVREWNAAAERIYGWSAGEARGMHAYELIVPANAQPTVSEAWARLIHGDEPAILVTENIGKDGGKFVCEWYNTPFHDASGHVSGVFTFVHAGTDHRRLERELRESKKYLETVINTEPECVKLVAADGSLIMMNPAGLSMIQADSLDQVRGKSIYNIVLQEYRDAFKKLTEEVFQGKSGNLTFEVSGARGRRLWLETHAVPLRNENDDIIALLGITRDVTEKKKAEEALKKERDFMSTVLDTVGSIVLVLARDGRIVRFNRSCEEVSGYRFEEVQDRFVWDILIPSEQVEGVQGVFKKLASGMFPNKYENYWVTKDGQRKLIAWSNTALLDRDGSVEYVIATGIDITAQRKAEGELLREKKFSDGVINSLPGLFYLFDESGRLLRWNHNEQEMTGYTIEELMNMNALQLFREDRDLFISKMQEVFDTGSFSMEAKIYTKNGMPIPFLLTGVRMIVDGMRYLVGVGIDISDRKQLEGQLLQSQKMESIGTLAGGISHDFNNILTAIIGYGSLLQMKMKENDPFRHYVGQILASANRAASLTKGLLAYSRKQVLNIQLVNINTIVRKVERLLERLIGEDVEIRSILIDQDIAVMADAGQIEYVLMNLVTNARDAMPNGGYVYIETRLVDLDEEAAKARDLRIPGTYALIEVTDSGMGMDQKIKGHIFEPFFTTKEVGQGTGLGLAVVYGIIRQHNGFIEVDSEVGRGTRFKIYLPAAQTNAEETQQDAALRIKGGTETILVAEDDEIVRGFVTSLLMQNGYTVIQAENGEDAVNKFMANRGTINLLLLDVMMPKKNGKEVYDKIRIFEPNIKALFLSGYTADIMHKKGLLENGVNILLKPVDMIDLQQKVRAILDE
jgi:two-component system cell cycle sensor histidine kinase/response regulator CckA